MTRKYPKKFCVVKAELQEGPAYKDGFKGSRYWIGAEWDLLVIPLILYQTSLQTGYTRQ